MATTLEGILDFMIPIGVWIFLAWVIYRIPIINEGVDKFKDWLRNRKANKPDQEEASFYQTIDYE